MVQLVSLRELNQHLTRYIQAVERGDEVIITRRGKPVVKMMASTEKRQFTPDQEEAWKRLLALMNKGISLRGDKWRRDELHER